VPGSESAEVTLVQGRQLLLAQPLHHREDRGVHEADVGILVAVAQLPDPVVVVGLEVLHLIGAEADANRILETCAEGVEGVSGMLVF